MSPAGPRDILFVPPSVEKGGSACRAGKWQTAGRGKPKGSPRGERAPSSRLGAGGARWGACWGVQCLSRSLIWSSAQRGRGRGLPAGERKNPKKPFKKGASGNCGRSLCSAADGRPRCSPCTARLFERWGPPFGSYTCISNNFLLSYFNYWLAWHAMRPRPPTPVARAHRRRRRCGRAWCRAGCSGARAERPSCRRACSSRPAA